MNHLPETGFLRLSQIIGNPKAKPPIPAVIPVSKSTWWEGVKSGRYPQPVRTLGRRITAAKDAHDTEQRKALQKELKDYQKRMADIITTETRVLFKERFPYPIFLYEAEKVGINATGEADQNELIPNDNLPPSVTKTCLEFYQEFKRNPEPFFITGAAQ